MDFNYEYDKDGINEIIDESQGSNTFLALRQIRWNDTDSFRLDLRKYIMKSDGTVFPGKGVSFQTPEGPRRLVNALISNGFANISEVTGVLMGSGYAKFVNAISENIETDFELDEFKKDLDAYYRKNKEEKKSAKDMLDEILK